MENLQICLELSKTFDSCVKADNGEQFEHNFGFVDD